MKQRGAQKTKLERRGLAGHLAFLHHRARHHLKHAFIPHVGNNFQPHALRPRALSIYAAIVIVAKLAVTGLLFTIYPTPGYYSTATSERFLELTNSSRQAAKAGLLTVSDKLTAAAEAKASDILRQDYFAHTTPQGKKFWQWIKEQGYQYSLAGENLALDFADADIAHDALIKSPGHRANILNGKYTQVGFAVKTGEFNGRTTTVLVELFGKPVSVVARPAAQPAKAGDTTAKPQPVKKPAPKPAPKPTVAQATTQVAPAESIPAYRTSRLAQNFEKLDLPSGESKVLTVEYRNDGSATWERDGAAAISLVTAAPLDRESGLAATSWPSPSRAATLAPPTVKPGEVGHWIFTVTGPVQTGAYAERFVLQLADGTVVPDSDVTFTVNVTAPASEPVPVPSATAATEPVPTESMPTEPDTALTSESLTDTGDVKTTGSKPLFAQPAAEVKPSLATLARNAVASSNVLFLFFLGFLTVALLVNIIVRYEVQHRHIIVGTLLLIALTAGMLVIGAHFLDVLPRTGPQIL